jgi:hypothetical protein
MKIPCHAAALALVGWYLIVPPIAYKNGHIDPDQPHDYPLSKWRTVQAFDSANQCETQAHAVRERLYTTIQHEFDVPASAGLPFAFAINHAKTPTEFDRIGWAMNEYLGQCIASDDPRLKENTDP